MVKDPVCGQDIDREEAVRLARTFGPLRRFVSAHRKSLIHRERLFGLFFKKKNNRRSCGNVGIAQRFPRAVGRVENVGLVFQAFHGTSFPQLGPRQFALVAFLCFSAVRRKR
jgi:hypothetical protein